MMFAGKFAGAPRNRRPLILIDLQQTMAAKAKPAGQRLGRQIQRSSKRGRQVHTPSDLRLWGGGSKVSNQDQAPRHAPFSQVRAYGDRFLQRPAVSANTQTANPGRQTPPRGLLATRGVCCG